MEQAPDANSNGDNSNKPGEIAETSSSNNARPPNYQKKSAEYYQRTKPLIWWLVGRHIVWTAKALDPYSALLTALATVALAVLTYFLAVYANDLGTVSGKQLEAMKGQQSVMQGQLDEMRLEQRPWLKVESSAGTGYDEGDGKIWAPHDVDLEITNTGKTPAFFVSIDFRITDANVHSATIEQEAACSPWRGKLGSRQIERGPTLFPGQSMTMSVGADLNPEKIAESKRVWENAVASGRIQRPPNYPHKELIFNPESFLYPQLSGCINYKSTPGGEWHQTGFIYDILHAPGIVPKSWKVKKPTWAPWYDSMDRGAYFAN